MTFALMSQIALGLLCAGVIVQTLRLMRRLETVARGGLADTVAALDRATAEARNVLSGLRATLGGDGAEMARHLAGARDLADELGVLIGIANAMADRLSDSREPAPAPEPAKPRRRRTKSTP